MRNVNGCLHVRFHGYTPVEQIAWNKTNYKATSDTIIFYIYLIMYPVPLCLFKSVRYSFIFIY